MDKQKGAIVEMYHLKSDLANELHYKQTTEECELDNFLDIASAVIDLGYRRNPKNVVVLTKEELSENYVERGTYNAEIEYRKVLEKRERKETAEKFAERLKEEAWAFNTDENGNVWDYSIMKSTIDGICKEITEGKV